MTTNLDVLDQYGLCLQGTASRTRPETPGFPFGRGGGGCHGTPGPPSFGKNGGHRTVAALAGSGTHPLRTLLIYDIVLD